MKINKKLFLVSILASVFLMSFASISLAGDYGLNKTIGANTSSLEKAFNVKAVNSGSADFLSTRLGSIVGTLLSFLGVLFMALVIYGGILWMTARGNEQQVEKAKDLLVNAIIGLIIVLAAYAITSFIGRELTDIPVTNTETATPTPATF